MRLAPLLLAGLFLGLLAAPVSAAGFDGKWIAEMPPQPAPCNATRVMQLVVSGNDLSGTLLDPWNRAATAISGKLDADGGGTINLPGVRGTIHFSGDRFEMNWVGGRCGSEAALGERAPTGEQARQMLAHRKQQQDLFADLVARANRGDRTVDYTTLRQAYPFTQNWDPYGNKSAELMVHADAAQKGGDCAGAVEALDRVIAADFTIDSAHALKADCLKDNPQQAAIENAIADGLVHSLMDSGDGASEKTAYVVSTAREEEDVLANHHVQFKTRQLNLRGSDGHYYDLIQATAMNTPANMPAQVKSYYFDVSAFFAGRLSRDTAQAAIVATIH